MSIQQSNLTAEEIARLGDEIYDRKIRSKVESNHQGQIAAIDVLTGAFIVDKTAINAAKLLRESYPAAEIWFVRIGQPALYRIGAGVL